MYDFILPHQSHVKIFKWGRLKRIFVFLLLLWFIPFNRTWSNETTQKNENREQTRPDFQSFKHISLAFAVPDLRQPETSFGHIFFIFHNLQSPKQSDPVVEFLGGVLTPLSHIQSVVWHYSGSYKISSWGKKLSLYNDLDRDIWILPFNITDKEKQNVISLIEEKLKSPQAPYNFFFLNCASYIFDILKEGLNNMNCRVKPYVLPLDTLYALQKCGKFKKEPIYVPAQASTLLKAYSQLNYGEKKEFKKIQADNRYELKNATQSLKAAVTEWSSYNISKTKDSEQLDHLKKVKKKYYTDTPKLFINNQFKELTVPRRFRLTLEAPINFNEFSLEISPGHLGFLNSLDGSFWADHLELLLLKLNWNWKTKKIFLSELNILNIKSTKPRNIVNTPIAKDIFVRYKTKTFNQDYWVKHIIGHYGIGLSFNMLPKLRWTFLFFLRGGLNWDLSQKKYMVGQGVSVYLFFYPFQQLRFKLEWNESIFQYNGLIKRDGKFQLVFLDWNTWIGSLHLQNASFKSKANHESVFRLAIKQIVLIQDRTASNRLP